MEVLFLYKHKEDLFSTGEIAKLCNISRKTLLFYDRIGIITPAYVDEDNGYRYYARRQIHTLELILTLRSLDLPLAHIQSYLKNKSLENYKQLLIKQNEIIEKRIYELKETRKELYHQISTISQYENTTLEKYVIEKSEEEYLFISKEIPINSNMKSRNKIYGAHFSELQKYVKCSNYMTGYLIDHEFNDANYSWRIKHFHHYLSKKLDTPFLHIKAAGNYLCYYYKGIFCLNSNDYISKLYKYILKHNLKIDGFIYVTQITNFWTTNKGSDYITKLSAKLL